MLRDPDSNREPSGYEPDELPIALSRYVIGGVKREQVSGIEPPSHPWQGRILTIVLHLLIGFVADIILFFRKLSTLNKD